MRNAISVPVEAVGNTSKRAGKKDTKAVAARRRVFEEFREVVAGAACKRAAVRASFAEKPFNSMDAGSWWNDDLIWATREVRKRFGVPESVLQNRTYVRKIPFRYYVQEIKEMATWLYPKTSTLKAKISMVDHIRNWREAEGGFEELKKLIQISGDWDWFVASFSVFLSQAFGDIVDSPNPTYERFVWMPHGPQRSGKTRFNEVVITEMYGKDNQTSAANWIKEGFTTPAKLFPMGRSDEMSWRNKEQFNLFKDETTSVSDRYINQKYVPEFVAKMRQSHLTTTNHDYAEIVERFGPQRRIMSFRFERREDIPNYEEQLHRVIGRICLAHTEEYFFDPGKVSEYNLIRESSSLDAPFNHIVIIYYFSENIHDDEDIYFYWDENPSDVYKGKIPLVMLSRHNIHLEGGRVLERMPLENDYNKKGLTEHQVYMWLTERFASVVKNITEEAVEHRSINQGNVERFLNRYCTSRYSKKRNATIWFLRKNWWDSIKQGESMELPEVLDPETIRCSLTTEKWKGFSVDALIENLTREKCTNLFDTVARSLEGIDYSTLVDRKKESMFQAIAIAQSYYKGHVVTGREEEDLGKICRHLLWLKKNHRMFDAGNTHVRVDDAVTRIKEVVSNNREFVNLVDRCMAGKEPSFAKKLTLQYVDGKKNPGTAHSDTSKIAGYLKYLKQNNESLTLEDGSKMSVLEAVERVRKTISYDTGHSDFFDQVYGNEYFGNKDRYEIIDKLQPPKKIAFDSNKKPIGAWGNDQEATPDTLSKAEGWGYNLMGSQFVVIDTDSEEAKATLISKFPRIEETLKTINTNKEGSCHFWLTTQHKLPRKQLGGYDLLGNAVNSATHEKGRMYLLGNGNIDHIDDVLKTPNMLKSVYEVFETDDPAEVMRRIEVIAT